MPTSLSRHFGCACEVAFSPVLEQFIHSRDIRGVRAVLFSTQLLTLLLSLKNLAGKFLALDLLLLEWLDLAMSRLDQEEQPAALGHRERRVRRARVVGGEGEPLTPSGWPV